MSNKRKLFIGSSTESLHIANDVKSKIEEPSSGLPDIEVDIWNATPWYNLKSALDSLHKNMDEYYYAIFIGYPDDKLEERGVEFYSMRDNTTFEFGLFFSKLGSERTFFLRPKNVPGHPQFKMLSDIGASPFVHFYELDFDSAGNWVFNSFDASQLIRLIKAQETKFEEIRLNPQNKLDQSTGIIESELKENNKNDEYYISKLKTGIENLLYAKQYATNINIQELTIDIVNAVKDVKDFCKPLQLAVKQSYRNGIKKVWVFSSNPFEFLPSNENHIKKIKETVVENLTNGVKYTYFLSHAEFKMSDVGNLIPDKNSSLRNNIEIIFIEAKHFKTFFTFHFKENDHLESLYMTSLLPNRDDLMIQISDPKHISRIKDRITKLKGAIGKTDKINVVDFTDNF